MTAAAPSSSSLRGLLASFSDLPQSIADVRLVDPAEEVAASRHGEHERAFMNAHGLSWPDMLVASGDLNVTLQQLSAAVRQEGPPPPVEAYADVLSACAHSADWRGALQVLQLMTDADVDHQAVHLAHAIRACGRAGEWKRAEVLLHRARRIGVPVNRFAYSHVIDACERAGEKEVSMRLYALGVQDGALEHWLEDEPFALDLHGFSEHTAACAVRYVLRHELGNYIQQDLRIVTGQGLHSEGAPLLQHRIRKLLAEELQPPLPFDAEQQIECGDRDCWLRVNAGCLVIAMHDLFQWLLETRPFESYVLKIPPVEASR